MSYDPQHRINDLLPREWRDFNCIKGNFIHDWPDLVLCVSTIINGLSVFLARGKTKQFSTREAKRLTNWEEAKELIGIIYFPLLLRWPRIKAGTTERICLECEIDLIRCSPSEPRILKSSCLLSCFQDTVRTASYSHLVSVSLLTALTSLTSINRGKNLSENSCECFSCFASLIMLAA